MNRATHAGPGRAGRWFVDVAGWAALLVVLAVGVLTVALPRIGGGAAYTILTGSMRPGLPPGTLVVTRPVDAAEVGVGDVITYQLRSGEAAVVTHRVTAVAYGADGDVAFTTRGDDNDAADPRPVQPAQVRGELWYAVPYVGYANTALTGHRRVVVLAVVAALLVGYAGWMFASSLREHRRAGRVEVS